MPERKRSRLRRLAGLTSMVAVLWAISSIAPARAHDDHGGDEHPAAAAPVAVCGEGTESVLFLAATLGGEGCAHPAVQAANVLGFAADIVDNDGWSSLTTDDFASYRAIALADPYCEFHGATAAAEATTGTWGPAVTGNVLVIGTDERWHDSQGGNALTNKGMAFATADASKTGAYISLSCYYHGTAPGTPVPVLDGFGAFEATGVGCYNNAHIVATHPALDGLTDATLSNWSCSVHEGITTWPLSFEVLAIARDFGSTYTAPDGSVGTPYILARGVDVISDIKLTPDDGLNDVGDQHTLTATVVEDDVPVVGTDVTFTVIDGPHAGVSGVAPTDGDGVATFSYTGTDPGTDTIEATFVDSQARTQRSNRVTKTWVLPEGPPGDPSCTDRLDNDLDGLTDGDDPGCIPPDACTAAGDDPGLLTEDTLGQTAFDGGLGALAPLVGDPDHAGPLSGTLHGGGDDTPLEVITDEGSCAVSLLGPDGDLL